MTFLPVEIRGGFLSTGDCLQLRKDDIIIGMKKWYKSKVIWLAIIQGIAGVIVAFTTQYPDVGGLLIGKSLIDMILRIVTDTQVTA